jgi:hypothetical protein
MSKPITACADCGTTGGLVHKRSIRPSRYNGSPYGFAGVLCSVCHNRHYRRAVAAANGTRRKGAKPVGQPLGAIRTHEPTPAEIAGQAKVLQFGSPWMARWLPVLTPGFDLADLAPRAACRLLIAESRRRASA